MTFRSDPHASIAFASTHWKFVMPHRRQNSSVSTQAKENLGLVEASLSKAYPVTETPCFDDLLTAIDEAELKIAMTRQQNV